MEKNNEPKRPNDSTPTRSEVESVTQVAQSQNKVVYGILIVLLIVASYLGYKYSLSSRKLTQNTKKITQPITSPTPTNSPTPTPTPIALKPGKGGYNISHAKSDGPLITKVLFDPLDVKINMPLSLSVEVVSASPVTVVVGTLQSDSKTTNLVFTKAKTKGETETWITEVTPSDTLWYTYIVSVTAENATGKTTIRVSPRS